MLHGNGAWEKGQNQGQVEQKEDEIKEAKKHKEIPSDRASQRAGEGIEHQMVVSLQSQMFACSLYKCAIK